jgi:hypothetical protein
MEDQKTFGESVDEYSELKDWQEDAKDRTKIKRFLESLEKTCARI